MTVWSGNLPDCLLRLISLALSVNAYQSLILPSSYKTTGLILSKMSVMRERYTENKLHILLAGRSLIARKGFSRVGLSEILAAADIPKGSFYHYFGSKERYGRELIEHYIAQYLEVQEQFFAEDGRNAREHLLSYWRHWMQNQCCEVADQHCLVVKLSAEVADLSEEMRVALHLGTQALMSRIAATIAAGVKEGSLHGVLDPPSTAQMLYQLWIGASLLNKLSRDRQALENAMEVTLRVLASP
jgi:TetR/AcrR family transcriptional repressor of nem operon